MLPHLRGRRSRFAPDDTFLTGTPRCGGGYARGEWPQGRRLSSASPTTPPISTPLRPCRVSLEMPPLRTAADAEFCLGLALQPDRRNRCGLQPIPKRGYWWLCLKRSTTSAPLRPAPRGTSRPPEARDPPSRTPPAGGEVHRIRRPSGTPDAAWHDGGLLPDPGLGG